MNTTNQLQILVQSISFPMLPLFMPSQESIVTGEINFPAGIPFLYPFYHPFLPIHSSRSHRLSIYPLTSISFPFSSISFPFSSLSFPFYPPNIQNHHIFPLNKHANQCSPFESNPVCIFSKRTAIAPEVIPLPYTRSPVRDQSRSSLPVSASFPQTTLHLLPVYYVRNELISGHINHLLAVAFSAERFLRQLVTDNRGNISHQFLHKPRSLALRHHATNCRISQGSALSSSGGRFGTCRPIPSTSSTACSHAVKRTQDPRELRSSSAYSRTFPCTLPILSRIQGKNYHNVVDINESLVALASQLLNKRLAVLTEMLKTVGRIDQLTAKTLKYAAL